MMINIIYLLHLVFNENLSLSPRATIDATQDWNLDRKPSSLSLQQNMIKFMKSGGPSWAAIKSNETTDDDRMTCLKNRENARSCQFLFSVWSNAESSMFLF